MNCLQKPLNEHSSLYSSMLPTQDSRWHVSSKYPFLLFPFQALGHTKDNMPYFFIPSTFPLQLSSLHSCGCTRELKVCSPAVSHQSPFLRVTCSIYSQFSQRPSYLNLGEGRTIYDHSDMGEETLIMNTDFSKDQFLPIQPQHSSFLYLLGTVQRSPLGKYLSSTGFKLGFGPQPQFWDNRKHPPLHPIISVSYFAIYCLHLNSPNSSCCSSLQPTLVQTEVVSGASNFPDVQSGPLTVASNLKNMSMVLNQNIMV